MAWSRLWAAAQSLARTSQPPTGGPAGGVPQSLLRYALASRTEFPLGSMVRAGAARTDASTPIVLCLTQQPELSVGRQKGLAVWPAGVAWPAAVPELELALSDAEAPPHGADKPLPLIVELGSGCGIVACALAHGAGYQVLATDGDADALRICESNLRANCGDSAAQSWRVMHMSWGDRWEAAAVAAAVAAHPGGEGIAVMADVVYPSNAGRGAAEALCETLAHSGCSRGLLLQTDHLTDPSLWPALEAAGFSPRKRPAKLLADHVALQGWPMIPSFTLCSITLPGLSS
ncbi:unnamed protein product [Polarella glacialis]|uniref:Calmodulin-lysine N-methyltransferase n=1 Tax=Polarella glacialis TaxID=89957 RepID=A0A813D8I1_POLGL|nr:unnamed protein product [Polarella glacialis]